MNLIHMHVFLQGSSVSHCVKKGQKPPYILLTGCKEQWQAFLVIDKSIVCEAPISVIPFIIISAFYTFNVQYPIGCQTAYSFLEYIVFGSSVKLPTSVKHFIASLQNVDVTVVDQL